MLYSFTLSFSLLLTLFYNIYLLVYQNDTIIRVDAITIYYLKQLYDMIHFIKKIYE